MLTDRTVAQRGLSERRLVVPRRQQRSAGASPCQWVLPREGQSDPKYGKFIQHEPAYAKVKIIRKQDKLAVEIEDFTSPTILERLSQQAGLLQPKIDDWRAMVDCVRIDPAYDGQVFTVAVALADVPEKKTDLVAGHYELPAPNGTTTVAVKLIDMLGEEVLTVRDA